MPRILRLMIVRRNGSIDFRVLATRAGWYLGASSVAALLGATIALFGS